MARKIISPAEKIMQEIYAKIPHSLSNGDIGYFAEKRAAVTLDVCYIPSFGITHGEENVYIDIYAISGRYPGAKGEAIGSIYYKNYTGKADTDFFSVLLPAVSNAADNVLRISKI